jgi:hypothetical protein
MRREGGKLPGMERESFGKSNQIKKAREFGPGGRIVGGGGSASAAVPGRRCEKSAGRGLRWAQVSRPCLDPHTASCESVGDWISVHCRTFCVELHVLSEW